MTRNISWKSTSDWVFKHYFDAMSFCPAITKNPGSYLLVFFEFLQSYFLAIRFGQSVSISREQPKFNLPFYEKYLRCCGRFLFEVKVKKRCCLIRCDIHNSHQCNAIFLRMFQNQNYQFVVVAMTDNCSYRIGPRVLVKVVDRTE